MYILSINMFKTIFEKLLVLVKNGDRIMQKISN